MAYDFCHHFHNKRGIMTSATSPSIHVYKGVDSEITFTDTPQHGLFVTIDTPRLHMRSVTKEDYEHYTKLLGDEVVMGKVLTGHPLTKEKVRKLIEGDVRRWEERDPYARLTIFKKSGSDFCGSAAFFHTGKAGETEIGGYGTKEYWGQGYGSEAARAMIREYAPATLKEGYTVDGSPLKRISATARPDNPASCKIIEQMGLHFSHQAEKFGALRNHYFVDLTETIP
jgi:RimJ/RimL family protein N-acetyltransferase